MKHACLAFFLPLVLSACGGGGDGSGVSDAIFADPVTVGPGEGVPSTNRPVLLEGRAVRTSVNDGTLSQFAGPADAELLISRRTRNQGPEAVRLTTNRRTIEVNLTEAQTVLMGRGQLFADGNAVILVPGDDAQFAAVAGWASTSGPDGTLGDGDTLAIGVFGSPTPPEDRRTGDATYRGESIGVIDAGGVTSLTSSDVTIAVTNGFSQVEITSANTVTERLDRSSSNAAPGFDFRATGTITSNGYNANGSGMRVSGNFYGGAADETAGIFSGKINGADYGGAYTAGQN